MRFLKIIKGRTQESLKRLLIMFHLMVDSFSRRTTVMERFTEKSVPLSFSNSDFCLKHADGKTKIVVMIPALNEEKTIGNVIIGVAKVFRKNSYKYEIVVVDDGSTDRTSEVAREAGSSVVEHYCNRGLAEAVKTGLNTAFQRNADIIVNIDADGQYRPEEIPRLINPILEGKADIVLGSRFLGRIEYMPFTKRFGNRVFTWIMRILLKFPFTDTQTGFRALSRDAAKKIVLKSRYTYTQEMLIHAMKLGLRIVELPIDFGQRKYGNSRLIFNPLSYAIKTIPIIFHAYREYYPSSLSARVLGFLSDKLFFRASSSD